jgi:hypothetical protein
VDDIRALLKFVLVAFLGLAVIGYIMARIPPPKSSAHLASPQVVPSKPALTATPVANPDADLERMEAFRKGGGAWQASESTDSMTGKAEIVLRMPASRFEKDKRGRRVSANLFVQCADGRTGVIVSTDTFISTSATSVISRIDERPAKTQPWRVSTDYQGLFSPQAVSYVKALGDADQFRVRFVPHGESPMEFSFTVAGLEAYVPKLRKACGW